MTRYYEALASTSETHEEIGARCETVLNTTMAEMETYHSQKLEDFTSLTKEHLDGEVELYEQVSGVIDVFLVVCLLVSHSFFSDTVKTESRKGEL